MPALERFMLHRMAELDETVRAAYAVYDFKRGLVGAVQFLRQRSVRPSISISARTAFIATGQTLSGARRRAR